MSEKLNIGITCYPSLGGSGVVATELGKLMAEKGHHVHFITHSVPFRLGHFHKNIFYHEVEVSDYAVFRYPPYDLSLASKLAQVATMQKLDVLHVHYALPHAICAYLAKQIVGEQLKVVTTLHGTDITVLAHEESLRELIRLAINESDAVTAVSQSLINETKQLLHIERPIDLTYNFVDYTQYDPRPNPEFRAEFAQPDEKLLIHISNFRPVKRVMDVIDIFVKVQEKIRAKLLFVGEGPDLAKAYERLKQLDLEDRVVFLGKQNTVSHVLSIADVLLLPSEKESFGLVALEAMACGVPTIASNTGGLPELISDAETGFLADVGDVDKMAAYALRLLSDKALYEQFSQACVSRARAKFDDRINAANYERIYYRVLGRVVGEGSMHYEQRK